MPRGERPSRRRKNVSHYSDDNPSCFTVKRKKGDPLPPKQYKLVPLPETPTPRKRRMRVLDAPVGPPIPQDDTLIHRVSVQPLLPVMLDASPPLQVRYPHVFTNHAFAEPPPHPEWTLLPTAYAGTLLERRGPNGAVVTLAPPPVSCMSTRHGQLVIGDYAGGVTIFDALRRPVAFVQTMAVKRDLQRVIKSKRTIFWPNQIRALSYNSGWLAVLTDTELEILKEGSISVWSGKVDASTANPLALPDLDVTVRGDTCHVLLTTGGRKLQNTAENALVVCVSVTGSSSTVTTFVSPPDVQASTSIWDMHYETAEKSEPWALVSNVNGTSVELLRTQSSGASIPHRFGEQKCIEPKIYQAGSYTFLILGTHGIKMLRSNTLELVHTFGDGVGLHNKAVHWTYCQWVAAPKYKADAVRRSKHRVWLEFDATEDASDPSAEDEFWLVGMPHADRGPEELMSTIYVWKPGLKEPLTTFETPRGGCLEISVKSEGQKGWRVLCTTAKGGDVWEKGGSVKSDFAGTMYPVGYVEVDENIDYIEDEDEFDRRVEMEEESEVESGTRSTRAARDLDLERALIASTAGNISCAEEINVLDAEGEEEHGVSCRPDLCVVSMLDTPESPGSPRSPLRTPSGVDSLHAEFLATMPQHQTVTERLARVQTEPHGLMKDVSEGSRVKTKRAVEVLLQSSIDPLRRKEMDVARAQQSCGAGSQMAKRARALSIETATVPTENDEVSSIKLTAVRTIEEKELALELLHLSPGKMTKKVPCVVNSLPKLPPLHTEDIQAVTPSESGTSPISNPQPFEETDSIKRRDTCLACKGRFVIHSCGRREAPIDYEKLARVEEARRLEKEQEKARKRAEKRKANEIRRREARKQKKLEQEKAQREEQQRQREIERKLAMERQEAAERGNIPLSSANRSSESLSAAGALFALAGIAEKMPATDATTAARPCDGQGANKGPHPWYNRQQAIWESQPYERSTQMSSLSESQQRRDAIAHAFLTNMNGSDKRDSCAPSAQQVKPQNCGMSSSAAASIGHGVYSFSTKPSEMLSLAALKNATTKSMKLPKSGNSLSHVASTVIKSTALSGNEAKPQQSTVRAKTVHANGIASSGGVVAGESTDSSLQSQRNCSETSGVSSVESKLAVSVLEDSASMKTQTTCTTANPLAEKTHVVAPSVFLPEATPDKRNGELPSVPLERPNIAIVSQETIPATNPDTQPDDT